MTKEDIQVNLIRDKMLQWHKEHGDLNEFLEENSRLTKEQNNLLIFGNKEGKWTKEE